MNTKKTLGVSMPQQMKERFNACLMEGEKPETVANAILSEFRVNELETILSELVSVYKKAPHLLQMFWQSSSDACPLEATQSEKQEDNFKKWMYVQLNQQ